MPTVSQVFARPTTGNPTLDAIIGPAVPWNYIGRNVLYYTFSLADGETASNSLDVSTVQAFNAAQQGFTREALAYVASVTGIQFVEVANGAQADLHFANADLYGYATGLASSAWRYTSSGAELTSLAIDSYVYLDHRDQVYSNLNPAPGTLAYETLLHEIGHVLGLKHPHDGTDHLPAGRGEGQDNTGTTLMSYIKVGGYHVGYAQADLQALHWLYGGDGLGGQAGLNASAAPVLPGTAPTTAGTDGPQRLLGTAAAETFFGGGGDDWIDGAGGVDVAVYAGARQDYAVTKTAAGALVVRDLTGAEGTDTLQNVERLKFADVSLALDVDGNAGLAYRLYEAALDRAPDLPGLGFQMAELDRGLALGQLAQNFIASPEFSSRYGPLDDGQFVQQLYANVLERAPDAAGLAYHVGRLAQGSGRNEVLLGFSESPENQAQVIGAIQDGMVYLG